jgi:hypothetical protein
VRHVVDVFGPDRRVVAMTITNEVNVTFSPNSSDRLRRAARGGLHAEAVVRRVPGADRRRSTRTGR